MAENTKVAAKKQVTASGLFPRFMGKKIESKGEKATPKLVQKVRS